MNSNIFAIEKNTKLKQITGAADKFRKNVYLVGGAVRDMLLKKNILDLDITVEGDASRLVKELSHLWKAKVIAYPEFGTYIIKLNNGKHIDFATARKETYPFAGSLPVVTFSNLKDDLFRRDFTINAMALVLNGENRGRIIDHYGGMKDLKARTLRVMHKESFKDDGTRILRLARFMARGFKAEKHTLSFLKRDGKYLNNIAMERIREELTAILNEKQPYRSLRLLEKWGILRFILPGVTLDSSTKKIDKTGGLVKRLNLLLSGADKEKRSQLLEGLKFERSIKNEIEKLNMPEKRKQVVSGKDLIALGYRPGPAFKDILKDTAKKGFISRQKALKYVIDNYPQKR